MSPSLDKKYLSVRCPKCRELISTTLEAPKDVPLKIDAAPGARLRLQCRNSKCMRFGKLQDIDMAGARFMEPGDPS